MIEQLRAAPAEFEFFQVLRLLEAHARETRPQASEPGHDAMPADEFVRLSVAPSLRFPDSEVFALQLGEPPSTANLRVNFLGLIGVSGTLPTHYTELVIERAHARDTSLRDLLDLFHHRTLSHFFRAWRKYKVQFEYESAAAAGREDCFTRALLALAGLGTPGLRERLAFGEHVLAFHVGAFSRKPRSACALEQLLSDYFGMPFRVEQFVGHWLEIPEHERSRLGGHGFQPRAAALGSGATLGSRVWHVCSKIRIHAGPLDPEQFARIHPHSRGQACLRDLVLAYLGTGTDFELVIRMPAAAAPPVRLGSGSSPGTQLGHEGWLLAARARGDLVQAAFCMDRN